MAGASSRNGSPRPRHHLAAELAVIATHLDAAQPDAHLIKLLERARCSSQEAAAAAPSMASLLANLAMALQTWQEVWPRLGSQREFRLAVAREARLWAERVG